GGDDLDARLAAVLLEGVPGGERERPDVRARVLAAAERAKCALSADERVEVAVAGGGRRTITRAEFEGLVRDLVERTGGPVRQALRDAGITPADVREVVAVGGST